MLNSKISIEILRGVTLNKPKCVVKKPTIYDIDETISYASVTAGEAPKTCKNPMESNEAKE